MTSTYLARCSGLLRPQLVSKRTPTKRPQFWSRSPSQPHTNRVILSSSSLYNQQTHLQRLRNSTSATETSNIYRPTFRHFMTSTRPSERLLIEGKTESLVFRLWDKYKYYAMGVGGVVATVSVVGATASAIAVGGLASLAGGVYVWYKSRMHKERNVLKSLYEPILLENRAKLDAYIGPWEFPSDQFIAADSARIKSPTGGNEHIVRNIFHLDGKYGKGFVRALGVEDPETSQFSLRKLVVDVADYRHSLQHTFSFVDIKPVLNYVDSPSFKAYTLREYVTRNRESADAQERKAAAAKTAATDSSKLYTNKPPQSKPSRKRTVK